MKILKIIFINIFVFIFIFTMTYILGELYVRYCLGFNKNTSWPMQVDSRIGCYFLPHKELTHSNYMDYCTTELTNSLGFLDREYSKEDLNEKIKIAFIGDSFVEAVQVNNNNKSHVVLEKLLNKNGEKYKTFAFGYSGTGQVNQFMYYQYVAKQFHPDAVVLVFVSNDFSNNSYIMESIRSGYDPEHHPRATLIKNADEFVFMNPDVDYYKFIIDKKPLRNNIINFIYRNSMLYRYIMRHLQVKFKFSYGYITGIFSLTTVNDRLLLLKKNEKYSDLLLQEDYMDINTLDSRFNEKHLTPLFEDAVNKTDFIFSKWKKASIDDNFKLVVLLTHSASFYCRENSPALDRIVNILNKYDIPYYNQCEYIKDKNILPADLNWKHDGHWNILGHETAARTLLPFFETWQ